MNTPLCENSNGDVKSTASSLSAVCINDVGAIIGKFTVLVQYKMMLGKVEVEGLDGPLITH